MQFGTPYDVDPETGEVAGLSKASGLTVMMGCPASSVKLLETDGEHERTAVSDE